MRAAPGTVCHLISHLQASVLLRHSMSFLLVTLDKSSHLSLVYWHAQRCIPYNSTQVTTYFSIPFYILVYSKDRKDIA